MSEENKALVRRWFEELVNQGDLGVADEIVAQAQGWIHQKLIAAR